MKAVSSVPFERLQDSSFEYWSAPDAPGRIMVVGNNTDVTRVMVDCLERLGHAVECIPDSRTALQMSLTHPPDLMILDVDLPNAEGYNVCTTLKGHTATWRIPIILVTPQVEREALLRAIEAEADSCVQKPIDMDEISTRVRVLLRAKRRHEWLERVEDVTFALARAVEAKDTYTEGHLRRMTEYSMVIGERLGLHRNELAALHYGALLHDIGKVGVDEGIIRKGGPLTPAEYALMQQHSVIGERIVQPLHLGATIGPIVRHHHERWDGTGYPDRLAGEEIPRGARIVAVADAFDAMTTQRPYNRVYSFAEAASRLRAGAGSIFDPRVVGVFLDWLVGMKMVV